MFVERFRIILVILLLFSLQSFASEPSIYVVKPGDKLSEILHRKKLRPLYGPHGLLEKIKKANQGTIQDVDRIYPGQEIILPNDIFRSVAQVVEEEQKTVVIPPVQEPVALAPPVISQPASPPLSPSLPAPPSLTPQPQDEFEPYSMVSLSLRADYIGLSGKDKSNGTQGKLLTNVNKQWQIDWTQIWEEDFQTAIFFGQKYVSLEPEKFGTPLYNTQPQLSILGFSATKKISTCWVLRASVDYSQHLFYRGYLGGGSGLEVNVVPLLSIHPELYYTLVQKKALKLDVFAGVSYYSSSSFDNYTINAGSGYNLGLQLSQVLQSKNNLYCRAGYESRRQETSLLQLNEQNVGAECGFQWRLQ